MTMKLATATADAALTSIATLLNTGLLRIYSGTEPATANTALSGNTLLAELTFAGTAFNTTTSDSGGTAGLTTTGSDRVMTAFAIANEDAALATETATFFRAVASGGSTTVYQGTVGTSGQQLNLSATNIVAGGVVSVSALTISLPLS